MNEITPLVQPTPLSLLELAVEKGADINQIKELMVLKREWEADEARKAYHEAVNLFKQNPPKVIKDAINKQYGSRYSTLANTVNTVNSALSKFDLNARWEFSQSDKIISVTCILSHRLGHYESATLSAPPDSSGSKNQTQQIKSTTTYLKNATFEAVTGIATYENNLDDDGNGAGINYINDDQVANIEALITETNSNRNKFLKYIKVNSLTEIPEENYEKVIKILEKQRGRTNGSTD